MICYRCQHVYDCYTVRSALNENFEIGNCRNFSEMTEYKYKHITENEALMKLIYDYFTDNICLLSREEAEIVITREIKRL